MALQEQWTINELLGEGGMVQVVDFTITFTDPDNYPGVSDVGIGRVPIDPSLNLMADTATSEQVMSAVQDALADRMGELRVFHTNQLKFLYTEAQAQTFPDSPAYMCALTPRQFRLGLVRAGYSIASVENALNQIPDTTAREEALIEWEYAGQFKRDHELINQIGGVLGLTEPQINDLWQQARTY